LAATEELTQDSIYQQTLDEIELIKGAGNTFDPDKIARGEQTPIFFGSALTNFGVQTFLDEFLKLAPAPSAHEMQDGPICQLVIHSFQGLFLKFRLI